ncbi:hypothetical protein [Micromonospora sp. C41]|uniref:hypothetical protein n=1 Tax=Micromonospora TaxID=1873 RepID=UPI001B38A5D5|nr:hypothetical protein [Micromonospora sp. C41]MBQ1065127.1 hypothetical protein [Micromonospora sp. C41]
MPNWDDVREDEERRNAFLGALWDRERAGQSPNLNQIAEDIGLEPNGRSVAQLSNDLRDAGYISGTGSWGGGIPRPRLTERGKQVVIRSITPANPAEPSRGSTNATISGVHIGDGNTVSFMQNSPGSTQNTAVTPLVQRRVLAWVDALEQGAHRYSYSSEQDLADVRELSAELRTEVNGEARRGRVRELVQNIVTLMSAATTMLASPGLVEAGNQLLQLLS